MTPAELKEATRLAAIAMGRPPNPTSYSSLALQRGDVETFDPLNNAEQQLEMRRVLRIGLLPFGGGVWGASSQSTNTYLYENPDEAALMVAASIGRRKEQA